MSADRRVIMVTGASRNLGAVCARRLARDGHDLVLTARAAGPRLDEVAADCRAAGAQVVTIFADLGAPGGAPTLADDALAAFGRIDGYVANAAIRPKDRLDDITDEQWHRVIDVDLTSSLQLARALVPPMADRGWGRVVHTSGLTGWIGSSDGAHLAAAKAGLHGLTRALAIEFAAQGVTINTVVPAAFSTERLRSSGATRDAALAELVQRIPVRRLGRPEEYAALCSYLVGEDAGFMTGQALHLNGGLRIG